jgi:RNase P subunit RPR2
MKCKNCDEILDFIKDSTVTTISETGVLISVECKKCNTEHYCSTGQVIIHDWHTHN